MLNSLELEFWAFGSLLTVRNTKQLSSQLEGGEAGTGDLSRASRSLGSVTVDGVLSSPF